MHKTIPRLAMAALLTAACLAETPTIPVSSVHPATISASELESVAAAAAERWEATGLSEAQREMLRGLRYEVADLGGSKLGAYREGGIAIDPDAAGEGWYVDPSPLSDEEFRNIGSSTQLAAREDIAARVDVLSVVLQEQGHALGLLDSFSDSADVRSRPLQLTRRIPPLSHLSPLSCLL